LLPWWSRARTLLLQLERAVGSDTADIEMDLEEVAAHLAPHKRRAIGPWIRRVEAAIDRERRRRRSPTSMVVGVLNDVVFGEHSLVRRGAVA
jgi:hypothetical protein